MIKNFLLNNKLAVVFFAIYFVVGCFVYDDYGVGWDEEAQHNIGAIMYEYASTQDSVKLFGEQQYQYHGAAWELFNYILEVKLNKREFKEYVLLKHFNNWLLFFIASIFLFLTAKKTASSAYIALIGVAMFVLSPRIFAESFYNSKDIVSLSFYTISIYSMLLFLERQTIFVAIFHAIVCALLIDVRITGVVIPGITFFFFTLNFILNKNRKYKNLIFLLLFFVVTIIFTVVFWPVLWKSPFEHFVAALQMMGKYKWGGSVLYFGEYYWSMSLPWHYAPVWIGITTPFLYLSLFFISLFFIFKQIIKSPINFYKENTKVLVFLLCFFIPLFSVIFLKSVLYDGWRHLYFIYAPLILIATWGVSHVEKSIKNFQLKKIVYLIVVLNAIIVITTMLLNHPQQHCYFNFIIGNGKTNQQKFEMDYWGLSYKQAIEKIAMKDTTKINCLKFENSPGYSNLNFLEKNNRNRFALCDTNEDYYITNYRWQNGKKIKGYNKVDSIVSYGKEICGVYVLKQKPVYSFKQNFSPVFLNFSTKHKNVVFVKHTINNEDFAFVDTNNKYPLGTSWECKTKESTKTFVSVKFRIKCLSNSNDIHFVIGTRNNINESNILMLNALKHSLTLSKNWQNFEIAKQAIVIPKGTKNIDVYFINNANQQFYIDDFQVIWSEV